MTKQEKRNLILGLAVVLLLSGVYAGILFYQGSRQERKDRRAKQEAEAAVLLSLDAGQIRRISFGNGQPVILERTERGWGSPVDPSFIASESRMSQMLSDLADLRMSRKLEETQDLQVFGLASPANQVTITMEDGTKHGLRLGNHSDSSRELYVQVDEDSAVYLTKTALDEHFFGDLNALASYETFPVIQASRIRMIDVKKEEDSFTLTTPGDDRCTVTDEAGNTQQADVGLVGNVQMALSNSFWLKNLEYHCTELSSYGLDVPKTQIIVQSEGDAGDEEKVCLLLGDVDPSGNYYVQLDGSSEVHTVRREYLEGLAEAGAQSFWSKNYSFVSIGDLDHLDVTMEGESHTLRRVSENGLQTDEDLIWYVDEAEVPKESFTKFYYACASVTAQERLGQVPGYDQEPELLLHYYLSDKTEKILNYYPADQNFYTVVYEDGTKAASINRLYVNTILESYRSLLKQAGIKTKQKG